jgi:hypothetical protein
VHLRFRTARERAPLREDGGPRTDEWSGAAWEVGLGLELELAAIDAALAHLDQRAPDAYLSINASAATLTSDAFADALHRVDGRRVPCGADDHGDGALGRLQSRGADLTPSKPVLHG